MTSISNRRVVAAIIAASCMAIPASAAALPDSSPVVSRSDSAQSGGDGKTDSRPAWLRAALAQERYYSSYGSSDKPKSTFPPVDFRGADSPVDHPGASRAQPEPTTVEVVRPERTIVREVDDALAIALSSTALVLVLAMIGIALARPRLVPRPGRSR